MNNNQNQEPPPQNGPPPMVRPNEKAPRTIEELCQPSINERGGPISSISIQAIDFGLRHHMIQEVQNTCQFHELPGDDANRHIDKFLEITQHMKQNEVSDDALCLSLFPYYLTHHAIAWIKYVDTKCESCGGPHYFTECPAVGGYTQETTYATTASSSSMGSLPSNTVLNPREDLKVITTCSGVTLAGPSVSPSSSSKELNREPEMITDQVLIESTNNVPPLVVQPSLASTSFSTNSSSKMPEVTKDTVQPSTENIQPSVAQKQNPIYEPVVAPKPKPTIPYPSRVNKQKLHEKDDNLASKFVEIFKFDECLALADLGASINLMPLSIWKKLSLPELTSTQMILELADRSTARPAGIAKDIFVKVGMFYFATDFVVVDYVVDPRVSLILGRPFLRTGPCEEYVQEVLGFFDNSKSGNPTPISDPIIALSSPSLTPFEGGDFILQEIEACLTSESIPLGIDDTDLDLEGDIHLLEELLINDQSLSPLPPK
uniref:Reverse transcriptase domain-containing protein n=1 Tax=Tanacetum cinerariifolium TaxID=118510 RepID=A0A6L2NVV9_TANCI|nr:reverse transcriptase domain-containing protein [Tanacetum cinerariifolium]